MCYGDKERQKSLKFFSTLPSSKYGFAFLFSSLSKSLLIFTLCLIGKFPQLFFATSSLNDFFYWLWGIFFILLFVVCETKLMRIKDAKHEAEDKYLI